MVKIADTVEKSLISSGTGIERRRFQLSGHLQELSRSMPDWLVFVLLAVVAAFAVVALMFLLARRLQNREPYRTVLQLRSRQKLRFFRYMATDSRVPRIVKVIPVLLAIYLATPIDIIPDFIPVLGYIDDVGVVVVALALMIRWTPNEAVLAIAERARGEQGTGNSSG